MTRLSSLPARPGTGARCSAPRSGPTCWPQTSRRCTRAASACGSTADGYLIDGSGDTVPGIVCVGSIRQGEEWETTAIPEIRTQAARYREAARRRHSRPTGARAPVSSRTAPTLTGAAASYAEGVRRLLAVQDGASTAFAAAVAEDPQHARAHVALAMIATERPDRAGGPDAVTGHLARCARGAGARQRRRPQPRRGHRDLV